MFERLIDLLVQFIELFRFWHVIDPYQEGLVLRLGKFNRRLKPGLNWLIPMAIERSMDMHVIPAIHSLGDESVSTKDGKSVGFHATVTYRIKDVEKALLEVYDCNHAVLDACAGEIGRVLRESTWEEIQQPDILDKMTAACRKRGFRYGIEIMSVQLAGAALCRTIRLMQK